MLNRFSIKQRMYFIIFLFFVLFISMIWFSISASNNVRDLAISDAAGIMLEDQKAKIQVATHSTALTIGQSIKKFNNKQDKIDAIRLALEDIRFETDKSGYYFVYEGTINIALPTNKSLQDKDLKDLKDKNGVYLVKDLRDSAKDGGGFVQYIWPKPGSGDVPKLAYAEMVPGTDFWIGTGVYLDNINTNTAKMKSEIAKKVKSMTIKMLGITGILFVIIAVLCLVVIYGMTKALTLISEGLNQGSEQVASASNEVSSSSQSLAEGSSQQAASIEETSSSMEEMASMTRQNAENSKYANTLMEDTSQVVTKANASMKLLISSMEEISKASEETSKIVKTIDEIAFQTNLLALNAAVEAARAGEAGAGFAVVADEVRNLAIRAADAARNTAEMIEGTVKKVNEGSDLVVTTNDNFSKVADSSGKVGELVAEIAQASNEQSDGINQVNIAISEMDKVVQQNAANAEESASASEEMNAQAQQLKEYVGDLVMVITGRGKSTSGISTKNNKDNITHRHHARLVQEKTREVKPDQLIPFGDDEF